MLKILVDGNIPARTVDELRLLGHDVHDFRGTDEQGIPDHIVWQRACDEYRLLVTTDKGFVHHRGPGHPGVLVVRLRQPNEEKIHQRVMTALRQFEATEWPGLIVVMRDAVQSVNRCEG